MLQPNPLIQLLSSGENTLSIKTLANNSLFERLYTNLLYIIYSPNPFSKAVDHSTHAALQELDYEELQAWLLDVQTKDPQLQVIRKSITINKLEK